MATIEIPQGPRVAWQPQRTLPGHSYTSEDVWQRERERLFFERWFCVGRVAEVADANAYLTADVAGESVFVVRSKDGALNGFYNTCSHRGTRLCDGAGTAKSGVFVCPYHAWTYDASGALVGTPNVLQDERLDRSRHGLTPVAVDTWDGFVFVNLSERPAPLLDQVRNDPTGPADYERWGTADLVVGARLEHDVAANWKIVVDNYNECLHCPGVHPELVNIVPIYRKGQVLEREGWAGVTIAGTSFTRTGTSRLPRLPGITEEDAHAYYGYFLFPNLLMNLLSDCVFSMRMQPRSVDRTTVVTEFMFRPETVEADDFDPSEIVEFVELVLRQDWEVCERVQLGAGSRGFRRGGVYPFADQLVHAFNSYYLEQMGEPPLGPV